MYDEEMYEARPQPRLIPGSEVTELRPCTACPQAYDPCRDAKTRLCQLDGRWCNATCAQLCQEVRTNQKIFIDPNDPVRQWANAGCPGGGADNTLLYVAAGGVALVALVAVAIVTTRRPRGLPKGGA